jgi:hypothetical protein
MRLNHGNGSSARFSGRFHTISLVYHEIPSWHGNSKPVRLGTALCLLFPSPDTSQILMPRWEYLFQLLHTNVLTLGLHYGVACFPSGEKQGDRQPLP